MENRIVVTRGEGADKRVKWVKGINCMVMHGNEIFGVGHAVGYTEVEI